MKSVKKLNDLLKLRDHIEQISSDTTFPLYEKIRESNPWFIQPFVQSALEGVLKLLDPENLDKWAESYDFNRTVSKKVGIVMAGNIPLVGFHDFLCVFMSPHTLSVKLSKKDEVLTPYLINQLIRIDPAVEEKIMISNTLKNVDAAIATGSDNTARYFNYYFRDRPHIIRKNRISVAVLTGNESDREMHGLADDVFLYFGLGCRNISKIFVPENYDPSRLMNTFQRYNWLGDHQKFVNNYIYYKSIYLLNRESHLDGGFFLIKNTPDLVSPASVLYYQNYRDIRETEKRLQEVEDHIQVIISHHDYIKNKIPFGKAQFPEIGDYADHVDTMKFLETL